MSNDNNDNHLFKASNIDSNNPTSPSPSSLDSSLLSSASGNIIRSSSS